MRSTRIFPILSPLVLLPLNLQDRQADGSIDGMATMLFEGRFPGRRTATSGVDGRYHRELAGEGATHLS
jgi:hypothetical protein